MELTRSKLLKLFIDNNAELIDLMKATDHHNRKTNSVSPYHLEGDVFTHTMMVFKEAITRYPNDNLLHIAVLCHDIGKCYAREVFFDEKKQIHKVSFIGHEGISVFIAVEVLKSFIFEPFNLTTDDKILILNTIALHGDFFDSFDNEKSQKKMVNKFNSYEQFEMVQKHLICDHNGRISYDDHRSDKVEAFTKSDYLVYSTNVNVVVNYINPNPPKLIVLVGPPCSGKSTYLANLITRDHVVISRDETLMEYGKEKYPNLKYSELFKALDPTDHETIDKLVTEKFMIATKHREDIIIDMTNMSPKSRRKWSQGTSNIVGKEYWKKAVMFYTGSDTLADRNAIRFEGTGKNIPATVIFNMCKNFKAPMYDEYDEIEYILEKELVS